MIDIHAKHRPGKETVTISGSLTVEHALELKTALQDALKRKAKSVVLTLGTITKVDLTFFQVLCSAHKTATTSGKSFSVEQCHQEILKQTHGSIGFTRRVGCALDSTKSCVFMMMSNS